MIATASPTLCTAWPCQPTHASFVLLCKSGCAGCYVDDPVRLGGRAVQSTMLDWIVSPEDLYVENLVLCGSVQMWWGGGLVGGS